jgi:hypothetical protein
VTPNQLEMTKQAHALLRAAGWRRLVESTPSEPPRLGEVVVESEGFRSPPIAVPADGLVDLWVLGSAVDVQAAAARLILCR